MAGSQRCGRPSKSVSAMTDLTTVTAQEPDSVLASKGHVFDVVRCREEWGHFSSLRQLNKVPRLGGKSDQWSGKSGRGASELVGEPAQLGWRRPAPCPEDHECVDRPVRAGGCRAVTKPSTRASAWC